MVSTIKNIFFSPLKTHTAYFLFHYSSWQTCNIPFCSNAPLLICGVLDDGLLSIYDVLLELMRQHTFGKESQKDRKEMNRRNRNTSSEHNPSASKSKRDAHLRSVSIWTTGLFCSKLLLLGCSKKQKKTQYTQIRKLILHYLMTKRLR